MALSRIAHYRRIPVGQIIQSEHQGLSWFAIIVSGVVKLVKAQHDGRQQIVGLQFPADFVGRPYTSKHSLVAEATTNLEVCCFAKNAFENLMQEHPSLEQALLRRALDELDASREWMFLLGRKTAREKVASLLSSVAMRFAQSGSEAECKPAALRFDLPLSRNEIADALGLTIETVSREIRYLKSNGVIFTAGRRNVIVPDLCVLKALAEGEEA
jgi:CRP/FNR family transcriptional regulator